MSSAADIISSSLWESFAAMAMLTFAFVIATEASTYPSGPEAMADAAASMDLPACSNAYCAELPIEEKPPICTS